MSDNLKIDIEKRLGDFQLKVRQDISSSGITAIFGPSGAGKSSLLKIIAGFETPDTGSLSLDGIELFNSEKKLNIPPFKRPIGYMFQDGRLFPHMSVQRNLEFAAERAVKRISIGHVVSAFDLNALLDKLPPTLSGGESRRASLARTVLTAPDILLLDEPLTGLDRARKREMLPFIEALPRDFKMPCIYVSHDIEEVSRLADKVMVISGGKVSMYGEAVEVLNHLDATPLNSDYAINSLFEGCITAHDEGFSLMQANIHGAEISFPAITGTSIGKTIRLRICATDVAIALSRPKNVSIRNIIPVKILGIEADKHAAYAIVKLSLNGAELRSLITRASLSDLGLKVGMSVYALIKSISFEGYS